MSSKHTVSPARRLAILADTSMLLACSIFTGGALAQSYPSKPITLISPFGPGGASDAVARALGAELAAELKQPVRIENRPGASGGVAGSVVARAAPNDYGYTLMLHALPNLIPPALSLEKTRGAAAS